MTVPPEVLGHIGTFMDRQSLYACTLVSQHWNDVFAPCLWRSIDSKYAPWSQGLEKVTDTTEVHQQRFSAMLQRHRLHIRDLKVKDLGLLRAAFEANLTELVSLRMDSSGFKSPIYFKSEPNSMSSLVPEDFDELIPEAAIDIGIYAGNRGYHINSNNSTETFPATPQRDDDLVHYSLTRLVIDSMDSVSQKLSPSSSLLWSRTLYPHVTTMIAKIKIRCALDLGRVLYVLPSAATLQIQGIKRSHQSHAKQEEIGWQCPVFETCGRDHAAVKALNISWVDFDPSVKMNAIYALMPLLTRIKLKHCYIDGTTLTAFSRHFKNLEYLEFLLNESCSKELLDLLVGCPKLKNCVGKGHVVMADDIVNSPEWTCLDLERLDIVVSGVLRLTKQQEAVLYLLQEQRRPNEAQATTAEEREALDHRVASYALHRKIYLRLSRHKRLRGFFLGTWVYYGHEKVEDCLELTLASGLDELVGLDMMEFISFTELNHRIGEAEEIWVKERWNLSRRPGRG
ncbi:hypothetical protein BGZ96_003965 [Linnemannia gamsii]|uniref:F-box domain-containing protein n=1 Tax=Linnemannia gamsii TaxID=64522 RepID=A0ABQ7K6Z7_9FUNG|nr:hypothetical protein BGZ96_003965 [Linnemannia gamsii]